MSESTFPAVPVTADELAVRWATRDAEYAKTGLAPDLAAAIRQGRMREADFLPNIADRARMYARAETWAPPVNPLNHDYGSMKDYLE